MKTTALLLIDIQNDYFKGGALSLPDMENAAQKASELLSFVRSRFMRVIHIQHITVREGVNFFLPKTKGVEINEIVKPVDGEPVVQKNYPNSFRETNLLDVLNTMGIEKLIICGAMSNMCIDATTRAAVDLGFKCSVAHDACAALSISFNGRNVDSANVHAAFMSALSLGYADVKSVSEIVRSFD